MKRQLSLIKTLIRVGVLNVAYMAWYRFSMKAGIRKYLFITKSFKQKIFFTKSKAKRDDYPESWKNQLIENADLIAQGKIRYYSFHWKQVGSPPNWYLNPFNNKEFLNSDTHWTSLPDFDQAVGDIKNIWEASRFEWLITLSRAYAISGNEKYLNTLNQWLQDWVEKNPLNIGPNWKCGQEASIRILNLLNSAYFLGQSLTPSSALIEFIQLSLERISKNIRYAIAQDNNHGTSEAAALFIGGSWLKKICPQVHRTAEKYQKKGRYWLENRVCKLISESGSFSQHSTNYHRVLIDTLSFVKFWRIHLDEKPFSDNFYKKIKLAIQWLYHTSDDISGFAPNIGANDGALLLNTHHCDYRDYRPSIQFAASLYFNQNWFKHNDAHNEPLYWFHRDQTEKPQAPMIKSFSDKGYACLRLSDSWCLIKWPYYKFRPSHNDPFHFDLWASGTNILCDAGTYSYNPDELLIPGLSSIKAHNTVAFDNQEPMPRISRFLIGNWLKIEEESLDIEKNIWSGVYKDDHGHYHRRVVSYDSGRWLIKDVLRCKSDKAQIGFNIHPSVKIMSINDTEMVTSVFKMVFPKNSQVKIGNIFASEYYMEKHFIKRVEIEVSGNSDSFTEIILKNHSDILVN